MCEFTEPGRLNSAMNHFARNPNSGLIRYVQRRFPYAFRPGCCPVCGQFLEDWQRMPVGRATRSMCEGDYLNQIAYSMSGACFVCRRALPGDKLASIRRNSREVAHHIHDGECMHMWTLIHNFSVRPPDMAYDHDPGFIELPPSARTATPSAFSVELLPVL